VRTLGGEWYWCVREQDVPALRDAYPEVTWDVLQLIPGCVAYSWEDVDLYICGEIETLCEPTELNVYKHRLHIDTVYDIEQGRRFVKIDSPWVVWKKNN
jgi:hypothetical protein